MQDAMLRYNRYSNEGFPDAPKRQAHLDLKKPASVDLDETNEVEYLGCGLSPGSGAVLKRSCSRKQDVTSGSLGVSMGQKVSSTYDRKKAEAKANVLKGGRFCSTKDASTHTSTIKQNAEEQKEAFKSMVALEIKRQVMDGLGETGDAEVQDVEIEDIISNIGVAHNANSEERSKSNSGESYVVKVKLLATVCIPIIVQTATANLQSTFGTQEKLEVENVLQNSSLNPMEFQTGKSSQELPEHPRSQVPLMRPQRMFEEQHDRQEHTEPQGKVEEQKVSQVVKFDGSLCRVPLNQRDKNASIVDVDNPHDISTKKDRFKSLLDVDDFEVYNFDTDRSEDKFVKGQIWALYDDRDEMPRHYAQITEAISASPFEVSITWLEPKTESMEALMWLTSGISLTCGEYELRKQQDPIKLTHVEHFSHAVKSEVGSKGEILISPSKGEVWALYKDQIPFSYTSQRIRGKYELVQVVHKDKESYTVTVVPLVKVAGFRTRFIQEQWPFKMAKKDFRVFSHQIPAYQLTEMLRVCLELDPASTPKLHN